MNYLLDTHTLLWSLIKPDKLSQQTQNILLNTENSLWVSSVSLWEISLKYSLGKLDLEGVLPEEILEGTKKAGYELLHISPEEASSFYKLPRYNKDPFDRMLAWQAINKNFILLSRDKSFDDYQEQGLKRV